MRTFKGSRLERTVQILVALDRDSVDRWGPGVALLSVAVSEREARGIRKKTGVSSQQ